MVAVTQLNSQNPFFDWQNKVNTNAFKQPTKEEAQKIYNHTAPILAPEMKRLLGNDVGLNDVGLKQIAENGEITQAGQPPIKFSPEAQEAARKLMELGGFSKIFNGEKDYLTANDLIIGYSYGIPYTGSWGDKLMNEIR